MRALKVLTISLLAFLSYSTYGASLRDTTFSVNRRYYAMVNGSLEKWDFNKDGSFLHEGVNGGGGTSVRGSERGTYSIQGNIIVLHVNKKTTAFITPGSRGTTQLGAASNASTQTRKMSIKLVGNDGENGVVLNGKPFNVRHWQ